MAIVFACACGKQLKTVEENAGKRVKCPACGQPVPVPSANAAAAPAPPPKAAAKAPAGDIVRFACECGKQLQARAEMAGKRIKCPACSNELAVPGPNGTAPAKPAVKKPDLAAATTRTPAKPKIHEPPPEPTAEEEGDFDQMPPVTKKKPAKKSTLPLLLGLAALLLVVLGGGAAAGWYFFLREDYTKPIRPGPPVAQTDKPKDPDKENPNPKPPDPVPVAEAAPDLDLIPRDAVGFATVRVSNVWDSPAGKQLRQEVLKDQLPMLEAFEKQLGLGVAEIERISLVALSPNFDANEGYLIAKTTKPFDQTKVLSVLVPGSVEKEIKGKKIFVAPPPQKPEEKGPVPAVHFISDHILVAGDPPILEKFLDQPVKPDATGPLSEALKLAAGKRHLVVGVNPPPEAIKQAAAGAPPDTLKAFGSLLEAKGGTITADLGADLQLEVNVAFPDEAKAGLAQGTLSTLIPLARPAVKQQLQGLGQPDLVKSLEKVLDSLVIEVKGKNVQLVMKTEGGVLPGLVSTLAATGMKLAAGAATAQVSLNNMRQLGLAMHNHNDAFQKLPDNIKDSDGKPLLSWRVQILPFIEEDALYKQFKFDEPWDSPHNMKLLDKMPKVFLMQERPSAPATTFFQVLTTPPNVAYDPKTCAPFGGPQPLRIPQSFRDGVTNSLLIVEAGEAVPWTKPADVPYDPKGPLPKFGDPTKPTWLAVIGDASARAIKRTVSEETLRSAICPADGKPLGKDWNE